MAMGGIAALDPREGTKLIVAECCRNLSTVGALPIATTNNLNFGNPERPEIMAQIVESIEGLAEACRFFEVPITGGNVSLYNETLGTPIFPTPVVGIVGTLETASADADSLPESGVVGGVAGGPSHNRYKRIRRDAVRESGPRQTVGQASGARYGLRKACAVDRTKMTVRKVESAHDLGED